jgi:hypothetical protein
MRAFVCAALALALALAGCNSLVGFDLEGGEDGDVGETKTLIVTRTGTMQGTVTSMPSGINCSPAIDNCSEDFPRGSTVTLTASAGGGSRFGGWNGGGCSGTGTCTVTLGIDTSVAADFVDASGGHNFAFVTAERYVPGNLGGLAGADAICNGEAAAAGLPGTYVAWLSTSTVAAKDRLGTSRGWVRSDGSPIADTIADLTSGKTLVPIRVTAAGTLAPLNGSAHTVVVTGTTMAGTLASANCVDWTTTAANDWVGNANNVGRSWTEWFEGPASDGNGCSGQLHLYCFGVGRTQALTIDPAPGRLAFVSGNAMTPGAGIASADTLCQTEATNAGRTGTFKAVLASTTASAASRFNEGGAPWVRPDGIPIAAPGTSPFDGVQAPLNVMLDGTYIEGSLVGAGAASPYDVATNRNCNDYTSTSMSQMATIGYANTSVEWFGNPNGSTAPCNQNPRVYCFQE